MSSYAFGGSPGGPCSVDRLTGEHRHSYSSPGVVGIEFARPIPVHAQTPEALEAVEAIRRQGYERRLQRVLDGLVTEHGVPYREPYDGPFPANARSLVRDAEAAGFETKVIPHVDGVRIEGHHPTRRVGFRALFTRGRADGASWHEPYRYAIVEDSRPVGVNALTRTGLAGKRPAGVGPQRLALLGTPKGLPISHTELRERINA